MMNLNTAHFEQSFEHEVFVDFFWLVLLDLIYCSLFISFGLYDLTDVCRV